MKKSISLLTFFLLINWANAQQVSNIKNSWLGNTSPDPDTFMPQGIEGMYVHPDGTVYTNIAWEEGGGTYTQIKNNQVSHAKHTFGWGAGGGKDICANSKYVYFSGTMGNEGGGLVDPQRWPAAGKEWLILWRRNKNDIDTGPTFKGAKGHELFKNYLVIKEVVGETSADITGVFANDTEVFVATGFENKIRVYDANTMAFKSAWASPNPWQMAMDSYGKIWVAEGLDAKKIRRYKADGTAENQVLELANGSLVGDFCIDKNDRILIGDVGPREQVLIYNNINSMPSLTGTFGKENGIYSGKKGKTGLLKFHQIRGIGTDQEGNIYIGNTQWHTIGPGIILESYNLSNSKFNWSKYCVMFVDAMGIDAATDGQDVYGVVEHFAIDYTKPTGQESTLVGYTVNRYKYPHDPRVNITQAGDGLASVAVRNFSGKKFLAMSGMNGGLDAVFRFNPPVDGEVAIACVYFGEGISDRFPGSIKGLWMWRDKNANGQMEVGEYISTPITGAPDGGYGAQMDENGDIWSAVGDSILHLKCLGVAPNGVPIYDGKYTSIAKPEPFISVRRIQYDQKNDRMYLGGKTINQPNVHPWRAMGRAIHRYDNWSQGNRTAKNELVVPFDLTNNAETTSFDVEQDYVFTAIDIGYTTNIDERENNNRPVMGQINVYNLKDNSPAGIIRPIWDNIGWMDMVQCIDVYKRKNGEYIIIQEDDGRNKNLLYRWCPTADCKQIPPTTTQISIFPNPSKTQLFISGNRYNSLKYKIYSMDGKIVQTGQVNEDIISVKNLKSGIYSIKIQTDKNESVHRFVKE